MIESFLGGLPSRLVEPMVREYEAKSRELHRMTERPGSRYAQAETLNTTAIEYVFALGIYYRYVLAPLYGAGGFLRELRSSSAIDLRFAGRAMDGHFLHSVERVEKRFRDIVTQFGIAETLLAETDVGRIVWKLRAIEKERGHDGPGH